MICSICGGHNVTWRGPLANLTHTECSDCGGTNCQEVEYEEQHEELETDLDVSTSLLSLLADIRAAVGDPNGKLMQDELVEHCRRVTDAARRADRLAKFQEERYGDNGEAARAAEKAMILACSMIDWPNNKADSQPINQ